MLSWSSILALTEDQPPLKTLEAQWQENLINLVLKDISEDGLHLIHKNGRKSEVADICQRWRGISCKNSRITTFLFSARKIGNFNIWALPHSTSYLSLPSCGQKYPMQTRSLPRHVETVILEKNKIYGRIDMTTLPSKIIRLYLEGNCMTGPLHLTELPDSLEVLDLRKNSIRQDTVYYGQLPKCLKYIIITDFQKSGNNKINEFRALYADHRAQDPKVFRGISQDKVF